MKEKVPLCMFSAITILCLVLFSVPVSAESVWNTEEIPTADNVSVVDAEISGDYIIFLAADDEMNLHENRIYLYNIPSGEVSPAGIPSENMTVTGGDISGGNAVWFETHPLLFDKTEEKTKPDTIYLMNLSTKSVRPLPLPGDAQWPKISEEAILWANSPENSPKTYFSIYDIRTNETREVFSAETSAADIVYDGKNIAYSDMKSLRLYNVDSGEDREVCVYEHSNDSGSNVDSYDMAGDYLVYIKRSVIFEGDDKGTFYEPYLYTISSGKTELLNPQTGAFAESLSKDETKTQIVSPFTDGETIGWGFLKPDYNSKIILISPKTKNASKIDVSGSVGNAGIDGKRVIWAASHYPSFKQTLYYAEENASQSGPAPAPGFSALAGILGISVCVFALCRTRR